MPGRSHTALLALAAAAVLAVVPAPPASATAPTCTTAQTAAKVQSEEPWPQKRYAPERLADLATGNGIVVAVIDSGVDQRHPQLTGRVDPGRDYLGGRNGWLDCTAHGTAVASIIAATARNGSGPRGLAPKARILPVRVSEQEIIDGEQSGETVTAAQFAESIRWAVDRGAHVLNLSVVLYRDDPAVRRAVTYALSKDVVVVAAAGNQYEQGNPVPYPAAYDGVLGVGSIGPDGTRSPFSQVGPYVDLVAPGGEVDAAAPVGGHLRVNGTSFAAPYVSATAALIRQYRPELSAAQVAARILATTDPAPGGKRTAYGAGVLNPYRAVTDTVGATAPRPVSTLRRQPPDPAALAQSQRRAEARTRSVWLGAALGGLAAVALLVAAVLPRGAARRWRPAEPD